MRFPIALCAVLTGFLASAQGVYIPSGSLSNMILDRMEIKSGRLAKPVEFNTSTKSYRRSAIAAFADSFDVSSTTLSRQDLANLHYLQHDNFEWSGTGMADRKANRKLYEHRAAFYDHCEKDFNVLINPVLYLQAGYDSRLSRMTVLNNRGFEVRGSIGNLGFYTQLSDEITDPNSWVMDYYRMDSVIPGAGLLKTTDFKTFNHNVVSGYLSYRLGNYMDFQFGHGRNFLGNGYRTFYQSDFSRDHLFFRVNTHFWKINYTNIWGTMYNYTNLSQTFVAPRHYYATTHLSLNVTRNLNLGLFQTISYQRSIGNLSLGMDAQYFNPVILYKPIENGINSPDKSILGMDWKYNFAQHFSLYGQFVISEFVFDEVFSNRGWKGNKMAFQGGLKYIDALGISNLDLQAEFNTATPYMYSSFNPLNAYVNYNQNMAHPTGANFRELILVGRYQPAEKLFLKATGIFSLYGNDTGSSNWGKDIRQDFDITPRLFNNVIGQGITTHYLLTDLTLSWMPWHNLFVDVAVAYRKTDGMGYFDSKAVWVNTGIRLNIVERRWDF